MLDVVIVTPQQVLFSGQASQVILPGAEGVFEVLPFHRPIVSLLLPGIVLIDERPIPIGRGVVKVAFDSVTAIVEPESA
jgi:F-type H+-transporting ATPase subunit epsilon